MFNFKKTVSHDLLNCIKALSPDVTLTEADVFSMFEYPPDANLGDIAFPCFKLSRILRKDTTAREVPSNILTLNSLNITLNKSLKSISSNAIPLYEQNAVGMHKFRLPFESSLINAGDV